ncbi:aminopeptidase P family protein [Salinicola acroporae]|uniref:aminopeptidase P family protein n=1 Tax=Salinicola acroporae TaxID=1541440 RepID=UPI001F0C53A7|nr:aminopeptidase P family protein [Salinicola acroporae]
MESDTLRHCRLGGYRLDFLNRARLSHDADQARQNASPSSRTFHVGPGTFSAYQRSLYRMDDDQVHHDMDILEPGMSYREIAERAWKIPQRFLDRRYPPVIHGVGVHGEIPLVAHHMDFDRF